MCIFLNMRDSLKTKAHLGLVSYYIQIILRFLENVISFFVFLMHTHNKKLSNISVDYMVFRFFVIQHHSHWLSYSVVEWLM